VLEVLQLTVRHGYLQALTDVSLTVSAGETVAIMGANGAGKSTLLRSIVGLHRPTAGSISLEGRPITTLPTHARVREGIALVPEGRRLFPSLSVEENVLVGRTAGRPGPWTTDRVYQLFPWMGERRHEPTVHLSGGEQQAVAIGRALMTNPRVLLLHEPTQGVDVGARAQIFERIRDAAQTGVAVLYASSEWDDLAHFCDRVLIFQNGRITSELRGSDLTPERIAEQSFIDMSGTRA